MNNHETVTHMAEHALMSAMETVKYDLASVASCVRGVDEMTDLRLLAAAADIARISVRLNEMVVRARERRDALAYLGALKEEALADRLGAEIRIANAPQTLADLYPSKTGHIHAEVISALKEER